MILDFIKNNSLRVFVFYIVTYMYLYIACIFTLILTNFAYLKEFSFFYFITILLCYPIFLKIKTFF